MATRRKKVDDDNPEVTAEQFAQARPATEAWPKELVEGFAERKRRGRGPQKKPTKVMVSIRLERDTLDAYKATGQGWQSRMGEDLARNVRAKTPRKARAGGSR